MAYQPVHLSGSSSRSGASKPRHHPGITECRYVLSNATTTTAKEREELLWCLGTQTPGHCAFLVKTQSLGKRFKLAHLLYIRRACRYLQADTHDVGNEGHGTRIFPLDQLGYTTVWGKLAASKFIPKWKKLLLNHRPVQLHGSIVVKVIVGISILSMPSPFDARISFWGYS